MGLHTYMHACINLLARCRFDATASVPAAWNVSPNACVTYLGGGRCLRSTTNWWQVFDHDNSGNQWTKSLLADGMQLYLGRQREKEVLPQTEFRRTLHQFQATAASSAIMGHGPWRDVDRINPASLLHSCMHSFLNTKANSRLASFSDNSALWLVCLGWL